MPSISNFDTAPTVNPTDWIVLDQLNPTGSTTTRKASALQVLLGSGGLLRSNNLSDVASPSAALLNLGGAPAASPTLTGAPVAPTPNTNDNSQRLATTEFVQIALSAFGGGVATVQSLLGLQGNIVLADLITHGVAALNSPGLTGIPTAPTAATPTNTAQIATTAFVQAVASSTVLSVNGVSGTITLAAHDIGALDRTANLSDINNAATALGNLNGAPLNSPGLSGVPTAPTAAPGTNTTQIATTAYVTGNFAVLNSPAFTGTPTATTATPGDNSTRVATTAFVTAAVAAGGGGGAVASVAGLTGTITLNQLVTAGLAPINNTAHTGSTSAVNLMVGGNAATGNVGPVVNSAAGNIRKVFYQTAGINRWRAGATATAEIAPVVISSSLSMSSGNTSMTFAATTGVVDGMTVTGHANIPVGAYVVSHTGTTVTFSQAATGTVPSTTAITFSSNIGSDYTVSAYDDSGAFIGANLSIARATGYITIGNTALPGAVFMLNSYGIPTSGGIIPRKYFGVQSGGLNRWTWGTDATSEIAATLQFTTTGTNSSGQAVINVTATTGLSTAGLYVTGDPGIPNLATVSSFTGTSITLSGNLTADIPTGTTILLSRNTGSKFVLQPYDDAGNIRPFSVLRVGRDTGAIEIGVDNRDAPGLTLTNAIVLGTTAASPTNNGWAFSVTKTGGTPAIGPIGVDTNIGFNLVAKGTASFTFSTGTVGTNVAILTLIPIASATNNIVIRNSVATGVAQIQLASAGANGSLLLGTATVATNITSNHIHLQNCSGTPSGTPVSPSSGVPSIHDSTNFNWYGYYNSAGGWRGVHMTNIQASFLASGITAFSGGGQGSATVLAAQNNILNTVAASADSVIVPASFSQSEIWLQNLGANPAALFPNSGARFGSGSTNASVSVPVGGWARILIASATQLYVQIGS